MAERPTVDVVVPFRGAPEELEVLRGRLTGLRLASGDTIVVVDNTVGPRPDPAPGPVPVLRAAEQATPGFARNRGAAAGSAAWLVFLDADTTPADDLLERYFEQPPAPRTGLLSGAVIDEPVDRRAPWSARYAYLEEMMHQRRTLHLGEWAFSQTANVAVRRDAFVAVGGFREDIRAGEDADLCYRLRRAGWEMERREQATVTHHNRQTIRGFIAQKAIHGAAMGWLNREYPGSSPPRGRLWRLCWATALIGLGLVRAAWYRDRDKLVRATMCAVEQLAFEFGRSLDNQRGSGFRRTDKDLPAAGMTPLER